MTNPESTDILATLLSRAEGNDLVARNELVNELSPHLRANMVSSQSLDVTAPIPFKRFP